ncbi:diguanylate cyclase (GGDEF)-like protein [Halanaerobium saccharolyticum]|uniref:Diguanylate cyclase (GGDEF)-like protein n=1 Tax=Halanaerobium saccharolyticum TaxID=43595 RepID=A0A4R6M0K3_9FIRM|nr:diguanylate cyclase [Halanaerobium saccharolyticum]TDO94708.1 diguanylate cyclase (GGDEF)-like protein [Halanaerobium saccharolyticum]
MQVETIQSQSLHELINFFKTVKDSPAQVVQVFSAKSESVNKRIISAFNRYLPLSTLIGVSAEEVIFENEVNVKTITAVALLFEKSSFKLLKSELSSRENAKKIMKEIESDTKAIIIFSDNQYNNGDNLVEELNKYNSEFLIAGGQAVTAEGSDSGYVFDKGGIIKKGSLALILNGSQLKAKWNYSMGWDSISREMEITKVEDQVVYELDGRNIFQVYSEYLGEDIKKELSSSEFTKFPLVFNHGFKNARSPMKLVGNGVKFSGELKVGDRVKISYGSLNKILTNSMRLQKNLDFHPEFSFIYSCSGRSKHLKYLNSNLSEEIKVIPSRKAGFCTHGEYGIIDNRFEYLNITTTVLYLSEKNEVVHQKIEFDTEKPDVKTEHLFYLSKKVVSELEMINDKMRKANQATGNHKVEETAAILFKMIFEEQNYTGGIIIQEAENLNKIYLDDNLGAKAYDVFKEFWQQRPTKISSRKNILGFKNAFLIPLAEEVEALMVILSNEVDLYDIKKNHLFIEQIPNYLKKAILYESLERNLASLSTLEQTSDFLYSTLDLDLLYERILDIIVGTMGMSAAVIFKQEDNKLKMMKNINVEAESELYYYLKGHYKDIAASEQILIENEINVFENIETLIAIPINLNDYQGILYAMQSKYQQLINENQKKFIRTLANQIRVSIRNALNHHKVKRLSVTDGLTNLYNHSYFHNQLQQKDGEKYSVAIMDIDNFKDFNDQYGHQAGDQVLRELSKVLQSEIRENDIVARYGGEEFVIYFKVVDQNILSRVISRLMNKIRNLEVNFEGEKLKITVSIGVAVNQEGKHSAERLIKQADTALYIAKGAGRDMVKFYRNLD